LEEFDMLRSFNHAAAALLLAALGSGLVQAKVSDEKAARLGKDLTPFGGEAAGNADGTIPEWSGKWKGLPPGLKYDGPGSKRPDPYADEKPLFSITPENYTEYKDRLSEGQIALFERYPIFRMDIYPSHRDFTYNDKIIEKVRWNATNTELSNGVESVKHFTGGTAFPLPQSPEEVMWNTRTNSCTESIHVAYDGYGVFSNGERAHDAVDFRQSFPFNDPDNPVPTTEEAVGDRVVFTRTARLAPPRQKGQVTAIQYPLD